MMYFIPSILACCAISIMASIIVVNQRRIINKLSSYETNSRHLHDQTTLRLGGIIILIGITVFLFSQHALYEQRFTLHLFVKILLSLLPILTLSMLEDFHITIRPKHRLLFTILSAIFAFILVAHENLTTIFDSPLSQLIFSFGAIILIIIIIQATNLIDGANGIILINASFIFLIICMLSYQTNQPTVFTLSLAGMIATISFLLWNYPYGLLFCGDTGAYFLGAYTSIISLLMYTPSTELSFFLPIALFSYPIYEISFTVTRRLVHRKALFLPDNDHLHHRLFNYLSHRKPSRSQKQLNNFLAPIMVGLQIPVFILCLLFPEHTIILIIGFLLTYSAYVMSYLCFWKPANLR